MTVYASLWGGQMDGLQVELSPGPAPELIGVVTGRPDLVIRSQPILLSHPAGLELYQRVPYSVRIRRGLQAPSHRIYVPLQVALRWSTEAST